MLASDQLKASLAQLVLQGGNFVLVTVRLHCQLGVELLFLLCHLHLPAAAGEQESRQEPQSGVRCLGQLLAPHHTPESGVAVNPGINERTNTDEACSVTGIKAGFKSHLGFKASLSLLVS